MYFCERMSLDEPAGVLLEFYSSNMKHTHMRWVRLTFDFQMKISEQRQMNAGYSFVVINFHVLLQNRKIFYISPFNSREIEVDE